MIAYDWFGYCAISFGKNLNGKFFKLSFRFSRFVCVCVWEREREREREGGRERQKEGEGERGRGGLRERSQTFPCSKFEWGFAFWSWLSLLSWNDSFVSGRRQSLVPSRPRRQPVRVFKVPALPPTGKRSSLWLWDASIKNSKGSNYLLFHTLSPTPNEFSSNQLWLGGRGGGIMCQKTWLNLLVFLLFSVPLISTLTFIISFLLLWI